MLEAFGRLSREPGSYVAVAGGSRGCEETKGTSCGEQDKQKEEWEEQEVLPAGVTLQGLRRTQHETEPLLVAPLLSQADAASLGKVGWYHLSVNAAELSKSLFQFIIIVRDIVLSWLALQRRFPKTLGKTLHFYDD